jgi:EmrB/QacA subfamily drug resistance transporter
MQEIVADARRWWLLAAMGAILGVILLDETVVGVALATIKSDLAMSDVASHWIVNVYMLVLAGLAAAAGKWGDIAGHKTVMNTGLSIFGLASVACGFSQSGVELIAMRGIQGVGAAVIFPSSLAMVTIAFPERQRGLALGIYGAIGTVFLALGPLVGGFFTDVLSWRWIFWVNPPIVVAAGSIVLATWIEPPRTGAAERIDRSGLLLLVGGMSMVVFATMQGPDWGWTNPAIYLQLVVGTILLVAFTIVERRKTAPLIDVTLFANPTFAGCNLIIFSAQFTKMAVFVFGAVYLQVALKMDPLIAGLALLPTVAPQPFTAPLAGYAADHFGVRWPSLGGLVFMLAGLAWVAIAMAWNAYALILPGLLLWGLSMAFLFVPPQRAVMNAVPPDKHGQAGGIAMSSQLLGATVGMAVSSSLFTTTGSFQVVFFANAAFTLIVLVTAWLTVERPAREAAAPVQHGP